LACVSIDSTRPRPDLSNRWLNDLKADSRKGNGERMVSMAGDARASAATERREPRVFAGIDNAASVLSNK